MLSRLFFLLLFPAFLSASLPGKINFYNGSLNMAKEKAAEEGKLYFVQFTASWCEPCNWMDEVTYKDPQLIAYINENYIPVKIDIDDFDGFAYKQMYDIRMLPSVLVFSSEGKLLNKYEEALAPLKMLKILKEHDVPSNRTIPRAYDQNGTAAASTPQKQYSPIKENISRPPLKPASTNDLVITSSAKKETSPMMESDIDEDVYLDEMNEGTNEGKIDNRSNNNTSSYKAQQFSVQVGVYSSSGNVEDKKAKLRKFFDEEFVVQSNQVNGKTSYQVMIGTFSDRDAAISFRKKVEARGFSGIVKKL